MARKGSEQRNRGRRPLPDEVPARLPPSGLQVASGTPDYIHRYAIYRGAWMLGTSDLEFVVQQEERASGVFYPEPAFLSVSKVFALYRKAASLDDSRLLREYVRQRDQLELEVWRASERLDAVVDLISRWDVRTYIIHVTSSDPGLWRWRFPDSY